MYEEDELQVVGESAASSRFLIGLGWLEIGLAGLGFVYVVCATFLKGLVPVPEPAIFSGLAPMVALFTAGTLLGAGAGLVKEERWPFVWHIPLALWGVIAYLAFGLPG